MGRGCLLVEVARIWCSLGDVFPVVYGHGASACFRQGSVAKSLPRAIPNSSRTTGCNHQKHRDELELTEPAREDLPCECPQPID